jgi:RNA polymerase sigma-70 factor (ECF subfamily)
MEATAVVGGRGVRASTVASEPFEEFFRREYGAVVAVARALTRDQGVAEDVAQEAMARAAARWGRVGAYDRPGAWVRRVAINLATSSLRRRAAERRATSRLGSLEGGRADAAADPVDGFWDLVAALPRRQAAAVTLHYVEDRSVADIAAVLGCAEGTAKAHLHKARSTLARRLAAELDDRGGPA